MKRIFLMVAVACLLAAGCQAEEWMTDLPKALTIAKAQNKWVLMDFTGSDWCPPCKRLEKMIFKSKEFADFAKTNLVLVQVDFPDRKQQSLELKKANAELNDKYQVNAAFPTVIVLDGNGKEVMRTLGYDDETPKEFIAKILKATSGK